MDIYFHRKSKSTHDGPKVKGVVNAHAHGPY